MTRVVLLIALSGCASAKLQEHAAAPPLAGRAMAAAVAGHTATTRAPSPVAPSPSATAVEPASTPMDELDFLGGPVDPALVATAAEPDYEVPEQVSENEALAIFLARNERLRAAWRSLEAARHRHGQVLALQRLAEQYESFSRSPDRPLPVQTPPSEEALRARVVEADVALERVRFEVQALELAQALVEAFHQARYQGRAMAVLGESAALARRLVKVASARLAANATTASDVLRAEMRLERLETRYRDARERRDAARRKLGALLDTAEPVTPGATGELPSRAPVTSIRSAAAEHAPEVREAWLRLERAEAMLALAERRSLPDWTLGTSQGADPEAPPAIGATAAPYLQELRDRAAAAARALAQARTLVPAVAQAAHADLGDALRRLRLYRSELIPRARRTLETVESEYRVGQRGWTDLDDAQQMWLDTMLGSAEAARDVHVAAVALARALGGHRPPADEEKK